MTKHLLPALAALALAATLLSAPHAHAQLTPLQDPANLAGERVSPQDPADTLPLNHGAPALQQLLAKLRTRASLMLIVAHPDDEDGGLLTYESRGLGARVAMLTLTRGEGGQNLMSADFDDALGLIRTQELLAADRYFGVDQFFGTEVDFGFSKTKEESFQKWTHERVLYDAVRAVRLYRPLVLASVFVGGPTDGHGQHQVSGEIAQEVFLAAADPKVFPEMIAQGILPWAPLKVYARVPFSRVTPEGMYDYATGKTIPTRFHNYVTGVDSTTVPTATVLIHEGDTPSDRTLAAAMGGDTFVQFARKGLALQKTQIGPNVRLAPPGRSDTGYTLMASRLNCPPGAIPETGCPTFATASPSLRWASTKPTNEQSLFDGIDTSLVGLASLAPQNAGLEKQLTKIDTLIGKATVEFNPLKLEATAAVLRNSLEAIDQLLNRLIPKSDPKNRFLHFPPPTEFVDLAHELRVKRVQCNDALVLALGLSMDAQDATARSQRVTPGSTLTVNARIAQHSDRPIQLYQSAVQFRWANAVTADSDLLRPRYPQILPLESIGVFKLPILEALHIPGSGLSISQSTRPYFNRPNLQQPFYDMDPFINEEFRNAPATPPPLTFEAEFIYEGVFLQLKTFIVSPFPVSGGSGSFSSVPQPAVVIPDISVEVSPRTGILSDAQKPIVIGTTIESNISNVDAALEVKLPEVRYICVPSKRNIELKKPGDDIAATFSVQFPDDHFSNGSSVYVNGLVTDLMPIAFLKGNTVTEGYKSVGYPGLPYTNFYTPATYRATAVDVTTAPNLHIAYLSGTGDTVPDFLPNLGITPTVLTLKDLTPANLKLYDAVLLGVRAYAAHPELAGPGSQPLLDYAKQGGVVILQYNTAKYGDAEAPFPIAVPGDSAHNVVEEAQPVTLLQSANPLLTWPNKITPADFDHWVAERGHGFAATWSPEYTPLLETHDAGQDPQQGGLLVARTGKGAYIYCPLALYRQLPEGVPGAYRLLANLLSYAKNPTR